jgi:glycosyltransferase involved in cell wall biosynthesis
MKLTVIDQTGDKIGGAQQSLELFLRNVPEDITPHVIFFERGAFAERIERLGLAVDVVPLADSISGSSRERPRVAALLELPRSVAALAAKLRADRPDLVYTSGVKAHVVGSLAARLSGLPSVPHHRDLLHGAGRALVLAITATCTGERIATSENVRRCYPLPDTTIIDNPVDLSLYRDLPERAAARAALGFPADVPLAAVVGRINRWKGIDRFLHAVEHVNRTTELHAAVVGAPHFRDADYVPEIRALCAALGLQERVRFIDWVEDPRLVYAGIDINVNAATREPFGRTIIEAAAAGIPSICFDDSGVAETMNASSGGRVVPAGDEGALAEALGDFASSRGARLAAGVAARRWSERFDAPLYARRVAEVLRRASARRRTRGGAPDAARPA